MEKKEFKSLKELVFEDPADEIEEGSDEFYREKGIAIYVKGECVIGLHPQMLEQKLEKLDSGEIKFNWKGLTNKEMPIFDFLKKKK